MTQTDLTKVHAETLKNVQGEITTRFDGSSSAVEGMKPGCSDLPPESALSTERHTPPGARNEHDRNANVHDCQMNRLMRCEPGG